MHEQELIHWIFGGFEEFIGSADLMPSPYQELKVLWAVGNGITLLGFLTTFALHIPFYASFNEKTELTLWIPSIGHIFYPEKVIENFIEEVESEKNE